MQVIEKSRNQFGLEAITPDLGSHQALYAERAPSASPAQWDGLTARHGGGGILGGLDADRAATRPEDQPAWSPDVPNNQGLSIDPAARPLASFRLKPPCNSFDSKRPRAPLDANQILGNAERLA